MEQYRDHVKGWQSQDLNAMHKEIYGIFYLKKKKRKKKRAYSTDIHSVRMKAGNKAA